MMSDDNTEESLTVRKVYVFPRDLAERIAAFQRAKNLPSEVEAVRRLLDEALLTRDDADLILTRMVNRLKTDGMVTSVAKDILVGHPLVASLEFASIDSVQFTLRDGSRYMVKDDGRAYQWVETNERSYWDDFIPF